MLKKLLTLIIILLIHFQGYAQEIDRVLIKGKISAPLDADVENISIYNISSQKGTITNAEGFFKLKVAENDKIQITALQFSSFSVRVDPTVLEKGKLEVYLNPAVNKLDDVVINQYDLTGNIETDIKTIKTFIVLPVKLSLGEIMDDSNMPHDKWSRIKGNVALNALVPNGGQDGVSINFVALAKMLFPNSSRKPFEKTEKIDITNALRERFNAGFIEREFGIASTNAEDFLYYIEENGFLESYLKPENELRMLEFMLEKSIAYKSKNEK